MCKSQAEGGQRCAAHTRAKYAKTSLDDPNWEQVAAEYASTREGRERLAEDAHTARYNRQYDLEARLLRARHRGESMREANKEAAAAIARADLTHWAPVDVDTELARLYGEAAQVQARRSTHDDYVMREVARTVHNRGFRGTATRAEVDAAIAAWRTEENLHPNSRTALREYDKARELDTKLAALHTQMEPLNAEFTRRGGWNRAFLVVTSGQGHVHRDMACSTCRPTTQYHWVTEMSDKSETEIVEAAGDRACTVCYPSAPVSALNRPTRLFTPEERAQQRARTDRAAAAEQRNADKIAKALTPDGSEFVVETGETTRIRGEERPRTERFKTERAATTWMVSNIADYRTWRSGDLPDGLAAAHDRIVEAMALKHGKPVEDVREDIEKKVAAKIRRDAR